MTIRSWESDPRAIEARRRFEAALLALARSQPVETFTVFIVLAENGLDDWSVRKDGLQLVVRGAVPGRQTES